ncbi:MAG TPA: leucyl/phenylalanyl-tRNA--protein transferase [Egibacteraceae bacterium]|nr:leucyl/phenylalanyl-tRNA--protein transferase [Egibacteraceae bacterium]
MRHPGAKRSRFPDANLLPGDQPFARGADYRTETLVDAYRHGIFPWPYDDGEVYWWSPDPRAIIELDALRVSRSLRQTLRREGWTFTYSTAFDRVVQECARARGALTWITPEYAAGYGALHRAGFAHSVEVWAGEELVGGLYGVTVGGVFTGESMFHRRTDASKAALVALRDRMRACGFGFIDAQLPTAHLLSMGASVVPRAEFLRRLGEQVVRPVRLI